MLTSFLANPISCSNHSSQSQHSTERQPLLPTILMNSYLKAPDCRPLDCKAKSNIRWGDSFLKIKSINQGKTFQIVLSPKQWGRGRVKIHFNTLVTTCFMERHHQPMRRSKPESASPKKQHKVDRTGAGYGRLQCPMSSHANMNFPKTRRN